MPRCAILFLSLRKHCSFIFFIYFLAATSSKYAEALASCRMFRRQRHFLLDASSVCYCTAPFSHDNVWDEPCVGNRCLSGLSRESFMALLLQYLLCRRKFSWGNTTNVYSFVGPLNLELCKCKCYPCMLPRALSRKLSSSLMDPRISSCDAHQGALRAWV